MGQAINLTSDDINLLSELRAPAAGLAAFGVLMLAGIVRSALTQASITAALIVFLAFPAGRLIGWLLDGTPSNSVIGALLIELVIAGLCIFAFRKRVQLMASESEGKLVASS